MLSYWWEQCQRLSSSVLSSSKWRTDSRHLRSVTSTTTTNTEHYILVHHTVCRVLSAVYKARCSKRNTVSHLGEIQLVDLRKYICALSPPPPPTPQVRLSTALCDEVQKSSQRCSGQVDLFAVNLCSICEEFQSSGKFSLWLRLSLTPSPSPCHSYTLSQKYKSGIIGEKYRWQNKRNTWNKPRKI